MIRSAASSSGAVSRVMIAFLNVQRERSGDE
jgi:hypothetical protein